MVLLKIITKNENIRKIFGKREIVIIQKQLLGVKLTQSEKNRLSRDIRKKLEVIKILSQYNEEFEVKSGAEIKRRIKDSVDIIINSKYHSKIKNIILFGSTVDNTRTLLSDIDLSGLFRDINKEEATRFRLDIMSKLDDNIDIQVYNILPEKLKEEIDKKGKILWTNA